MNRGRHKKGKEKEFNTQFEFGHNAKIFKYKHG